jgi:hypothetical protein
MFYRGGASTIGSKEARCMTTTDKLFAKDLLAGKVAYVAGGTRGINLGIAKAFIAHGAKVAVMSRNPERVQAAVDELMALGGEARGFSSDVRDYDKTAATIRETADAFGKLDIVVAGQAGNFYAPAVGMSANGFKSVIDIDVLGTFNVFRAAFEHLRAPGASLIAISAPEGSRPLHFQSHVCTAKAAVNMMIKCLALEWGPAGVRVNGISPGPIEQSFGMDNVAAPSAELKAHITKALPLQRWGTNDDIARSALFLGSEAGAYITGTVLDTDGGVCVMSPESGRVDAVFDWQRDPRVKGAAKSSSDKASR